MSRRMLRRSMAIGVVLLLPAMVACSPSPTVSSQTVSSQTVSSQTASTPQETQQTPPRLVGFSPGGGFVGLPRPALVRELDAMASPGARWVRVDFDWPSVQPDEGTWDWAAIDRVVTAATERGLRILALVAYTPAWARPEGSSDKHPPTDPADFATFVSAAAERYAPRGVRAWEVWNEPNVAAFWEPAPSARDYTALLVPAAAALHRVDPGAVVLTGGLAPALDTTASISPAAFVSAVYAAGGGPSFDAVGVHPYCYPASPLDTSTASWNTFVRLPRIHDLMVDEGDGDKRVWLTEYGAPTGTADGAVTGRQQAALIVDGLAAARRLAWTGPLFVYSYRDAGTDRADREDHFGLVRRDFTPKPAWAALRAQIRTR